jgi:thiamine transport system ATP-binding protein
MRKADMLHLDHLRLTFPGFTLTANWSVPAGQSLALIGPSGAGKSTLLMAIAGFLPIEGRILWQGEDLAPLLPAKRPVSILFQDQNLFPHLTLLQNLGLALSPELRLSAVQRDKVSATLTRLGLPGTEGRKPGALSGGQQARAALGRVLLQNRPILLLDEPFAALGPALKRDLLDLVRDLAVERGTTVILVSHDPQDARHFAASTVLVSDGVASSPVPTEDIFTNPPAALRDYLGQT